MLERQKMRQQILRLAIPGVTRASSTTDEQAQCKKRQRAIDQTSREQTCTNDEPLEFGTVMINVANSLQHAPRREGE